MTSTEDRGLTKLTAKLYAPMYADFDRQLSNALLRRDAFLDRVIWQEIPYLREDLMGKRLSVEANRHISAQLKSLGGKSAPPLKQVSIAVRHETAEALRAVVEEHNLVRDAFLNRLLALLRSSDKLLEALGLPSRVTWNRRDGTEDASTSPLRSIEETLSDPFHYLRSACHSRYGYGLHMLEFPVEFMGLYCFMDDDQVPGTLAYKTRSSADPALLTLLDDLESNLTPSNPQGV
jgi:hypothetical protein